MPSGDDAAGIYYTQQTYDWKGRPRISTKPDNTTKEVSYAGCGCAGGEVVTLTDEGTVDAGVAKRRQQKIYSDVLGRTVKTEILNWQNGSVYSATVNTYNARDQIEQVREYVGPEGSGTYQTTTLTYDGYGRLKTKHVPEQDAGTATVWTYNSDDTINTVTDARGATTTFGYAGTNRRLVKTLTYTLSGSPTLNVSYNYDAAGNRTSMTDGLGSIAYARNQLSQLTSETRTFTGVGNFAIDYGYNLAGQLTSITDPFGAQVGYTYDNAARTTAITGSNFASVSTYASGLQYRAWGALKAMTYGNSKTLSMTYNSNLNVATYEIPGLMKKSYQYYNDGRLKFTQDQFLTNSKFDRLYNHDHMGRITSALSGAEARGGGPTDDRPYKETMAYDAMGHLNLREVRQWNRYDTTGTETYINNRRQYWQYDADGRLLGGSSSYTYNAAGQMSTFGDEAYETDQQFDGDGRRIKSTLKNYDPNTDQWMTEKITYYIHSSILGEAVSEVSAEGAKERSFVFAGGRVMAIQDTDGGQSVTWQHYDASGGTYRGSDSQGAWIGSAERDPMGADAGIFKPFTWPPPTSPGKLAPYYGVPELNSAFSGCVLDDIPVPCDLVTNDNSVQCPDNQCKKGDKFFRAFNDGYSGYVPADARYIGYGIALSDRAANGSLDELAGVVALGSSPQNPTVDTSDVRAYRARIEQMLKDQKCKNFLEQLLNEAKAQTGKSYMDILTTFDQLKFFWGETGARGAFAHFDHGAPAATIRNTIITERPSGSLANQNDRRGYLISQTTQGFLGETLHHVGEGFAYGDGAMANALNAILVRQGRDTPEKFSDLTQEGIDHASIYWHPKVWAACPAPRK